MGVRLLDYSPLRAAMLGLAALAAAMGIGRFAFTPLLPFMQARGDLTLAQGSVLASSNYAGYLLGALLCLALSVRPVRFARIGLVIVAVATVAMAMTSSFAIWFWLRLVAGTGSALVLIGISAWSANAIGVERWRAVSGWVFGGVGIGIFVAGMVGLLLGIAGETPARAWLTLGILAAIVAAVSLRYLTETGPAQSAPSEASTACFCREEWRVIACYGALGLGYIVPATFLPAVARTLVPDPVLFGWAWPVFGLAAAASTILTGAALGHLPPRQVWKWGQVIMGVGVAVPGVHLSLASVIASAICVGGTFMVLTMAGMQEARRMRGVHAGRLMAAMTVAFAVGQLLGPIAANATMPFDGSLRVASLGAGCLLLISAAALRRLPVSVNKSCPV